MGILAWIVLGTDRGRDRQGHHAGQRSRRIIVYHDYRIIVRYWWLPREHADGRGLNGFQSRHNSRFIVALIFL